MHAPDLAYRAITGEVYHIDPTCPVGRLIPAEWRAPGDDGLPLCPACRARTEARAAKAGPADREPG